jgi:hypothetical protein
VLFTPDVFQRVALAEPGELLRGQSGLQGVDALDWPGVDVARGEMGAGLPSSSVVRPFVLGMVGAYQNVAGLPWVPIHPLDRWSILP